MECNLIKNLRSFFVVKPWPKAIQHEWVDSESVHQIHQDHRNSCHTDAFALFHKVRLTDIRSEEM